MNQKGDCSIAQNDYMGDQDFALSRIKVVLKLILGILLLQVLIGLTIFDSVESIYTLISAFFMVSALHLIVTEDTVSMVAGILIWLLAVTLFYLAWHHSGLFSTAIVAMPVIIIIAVTFTRRVVYVPLLIFMITGLFFFGWGYKNGLMMLPKVAEDYPFYGKAVDVIIIIASVFVFIEMLIRSAKKKLYALLKENDQLRSEIENAHKITDYDALTQLPNERICKKVIDEHINSTKIESDLLGLLSINIHNLKAINTSIGHEAVDQILIQFADRLSTLTSDSVSLYRIQGNEFVALKKAPDHHEIVSFAEQIIQATKAPFNTEDYELEISSSVGIAVAPFDGRSMEELRKKSHLALVYKKDEKDQAFHFFDTHMVNDNQDRVLLLADLKRAIDDQDFELHFQPKVDLSTRQIIGAEALIRWHRKGHGMVRPDIFIALAEESGLIGKISQWVAINAIQACKQWHDLGLRHLSIAINLSEVDFRRGNLPQKLISYLNDAQLAPHYLEVELTESMIIDDVSHVQKQIQILHNKGISLAIDDFGTGYSNLGYLSKFNVSSLKIDQSFIRHLDESEHDYHIVKAIIQMGNSLGIAIVAEGIETTAVEAKLKALSCQFGQGYLWSKPLPNEEFIKLISQETLETSA